MTPVVSLRHIGGRMIRVGALPGGDYFEVDSYNSVAPQSVNEHTRMALFHFPVDFPAPPTRGGIVGGSPVDNDAKLTVPGTFDCSPTVTGIQYCYDDSRENYLLVGKTSNTYTAVNNNASDTMLRADIIHGPLNAGRITGTFETAGATYVATPAVKLPPGRYLIGIEVWVEDAPGDTTYVLNPSQGRNRGRMNGPAFDYSVAFGGTTNAGSFTVPVTPVRKIPLGAFGSSGSPAHRHRFYQEVDVVPYFDPQTGQQANWYYSPVITNKAVRVHPYGTWFAQRNAEGAQLGVATANMYYRQAGGEYPSVSLGEFQNAADLLGARGVPYSFTAPVTPNNFSFSDPLSRGRFQFNADVVHMTEMGKLVFDSCEVTHSANQRRVFGDVLYRSDSRQWRNVYGVDENLKNLPFCSDREGLGAIFVASSQWVNGYPVSYLNDPTRLCQHDTEYPGDNYSTGQVNCSLTNNGRQFQPVPIKVRSSLTAYGYLWARRCPSGSHRLRRTTTCGGNNMANVRVPIASRPKASLVFG